MKSSRRKAFTLLELLVVISIIGLLIGILVPSLSRIRKQSKRAVCMSNLRQISTAISAYRHLNRGHYPAARAMPEPFVITTITDPPLFVALQRDIPKDSRVYACPGDQGYVYDRCGISYGYIDINDPGHPPEQPFVRRKFGTPLSNIPILYDFDGDTIDTPAGPVTIPFFHVRRNLLFADGHVGEFNPPPAGEIPPITPPTPPTN